MILGALLFGMSISELSTIVGLIWLFGGGIIVIRNGQVKLQVKMLELENRISKQERDLELTKENFHIEIEKTNSKIEDKIDRLDIKLDNMLEIISNIKINCAYQNHKNE